MTVAPDVEETRRPGEAALVYVERMAREKADAGRALCARQGFPLRPVLGADTVVIVDEDVLAKTADRGEARRQLARLSGREHLVVTAVCLSGTAVRSAVSRTRVVFKSLSAAEIARYCATREPLGKAGSYAIQGRGGMFVTHLSGSYSGVVGLPLYECAGLLRDEGLL